MSARWIAEHQSDEGGTSSSQATLGRALRGSRGPFSGVFGNLNLGFTKILGRLLNDARVAVQSTNVRRGDPEAIVPQVTITGITAPFGDVFIDRSRLRTLEFRGILTLDRGSHAIRMGVEVRRITKTLADGPPQAGTFAFNSLADFVADRPFRRTLTASGSKLPSRVGTASGKSYALSQLEVATELAYGFTGTTPSDAAHRAR